jgi:hypothetical protein
VNAHAATVIAARCTSAERPFSSQKVWIETFAVGAAATCRLAKIYLTAVVWARSYLEKRDGFGSIPDQGFHPYGEPSGSNAEVRLVAGNFIKADFSDPRTATNQARYFFILLLPGALLLTGGVCAFAARRPLKAAVCTFIFTGSSSQD